MTNEYTPSFDEIRDAYAESDYFKSSRGSFDRWLAEYTRQQREEAWSGGYRKGYSEGMYDIQPTPNPYRRTES